MSKNLLYTTLTIEYLLLADLKGRKNFVKFNLMEAVGEMFPTGQPRSGKFTILTFSLSI